MTYVIRSMSTSDWNGRDPVVPYHIYLMKPEKRRGAYWSTYMLDAMKFDSIEAAEAEWHRSRIDGRGRTDIAPINHPVPVWDAIHYKPEQAQ
jgi:hypothetical protein